MPQAILLFTKTGVIDITGSEGQDLCSLKDVGEVLHDPGTNESNMIEYQSAENTGETLETEALAFQMIEEHVATVASEIPVTKDFFIMDIEITIY